MDPTEIGYLDITDHYRRLIADRQITDGARLPSVRDIATEWGVATKTAQRALKALSMEGYASAVRGLGYAATFRPHDFATLRVRVNGSRERGEAYAPGDEQRILSAKLTPAGGAVSEVLGIEPTDLAVLRTGSVTRAGRVIRMSHSWFPAELADLVPELLTTESTPPGNVARIEAATGRRTELTADHFTVDLTALQHVQGFGVAQGTPVLVRTTVRHDGQGVIEYGTTWFPRNVVLAVEYNEVAGN
ncbi:GntR family transcriptional regulator [Streptomyces sp. NBC_00513]|uniref:GntR family transcriptional regulator n=1 Tax=unclassified Streptomyces TaxID=2593676 RepID=UPI00225927D4|nr:GntR family transcriptional regulator [Streptomyces sp. NBC_00424]MCX5079381.1 GntR family transcriptional regulator [Streptomyces sp. NBC_00424]MCX5079391.1 GntR family transcriptional regulator [Streptomyces sp. NBC_00424]WUD46453.1 GntR family transcriptional regulator [Streptomyces sp. NBC_00513]WUD46463.1 GntR family transcriptional regulator [Streptomyces sp. NBC_00513]